MLPKKPKKWPKPKKKRVTYEFNTVYINSTQIQAFIDECPGLKGTKSHWVRGLHGPDDHFWRIQKNEVNLDEPRSLDTDFFFQLSRFAERKTTEGMDTLEVGPIEEFFGPYRDGSKYDLDTRYRGSAA